MAEYQMVVGGFLNNPLTGRRPIETPETEINRENVLKVVMGKAEPIHLLNKNEIRFLHNYYLGSQPVLLRTKEYHAEITNRIVENHANECVGFYTGYMSGTPCSYVRSETATGDGEEIARLSNALQYEGKDALDRRLWQWMLECGQGYRIVLPDRGYSGNYPDETPLLVDVPDPDMAYVIYNSGIGHKPIANVLHIPRNYQNDLNDLICVYTPKARFTTAAIMRFLIFSSVMETKLPVAWKSSCSLTASRLLLQSKSSRLTVACKLWGRKCIAIKEGTVNYASSCISKRRRFARAFLL